MLKMKNLVITILDILTYNDVTKGKKEYMLFWIIFLPYFIKWIVNKTKQYKKDVLETKSFQLFSFNLVVES